MPAIAPFLVSAAGLALGTRWLTRKPQDPKGFENLGIVALRMDQPEQARTALATIKADGKATGGHCAVIEVLSPQGNGPPLHVHRNEDEWFYVLEGEMLFWVDGKTIKCGPGSFAFAPRSATSNLQPRFCGFSLI